MSAFRIIGDTIEYEFVPVARFLAGAPVGKAEDAANDLEAMDSARVAEDHAQEIADLEEAHAVELDHLQKQIDKLEPLVISLQRALNDIEAAAGLTGHIANVEAKAAEWEALARKYADHIRELRAPKPRKRKL